MLAERSLNCRVLRVRSEFYRLLRTDDFHRSVSYRSLQNECFFFSAHANRRRRFGRVSGHSLTRLERLDCADSGRSLPPCGKAQFDRGCVKTSARFHTSLFRSLLRGLRAFRVEKIAKNLALLDRLQNVAEFLHGLGPIAAVPGRSQYVRNGDDVKNGRSGPDEW